MSSVTLRENLMPRPAAPRAISPVWLRGVAPPLRVMLLKSSMNQSSATKVLNSLFLSLFDAPHLRRWMALLDPKLSSLLPEAASSFADLALECARILVRFEWINQTLFHSLEEEFPTRCAEIKRVSESCLQPVTSPPDASPNTLQYVAALDKWQEKLAFLLAQEPVVADPEQKFRIAQLIQEARRKIFELNAETGGPSQSPHSPTTRNGESAA